MSLPAQDITTAATPSASATTRRRVTCSPNIHPASTAVSTGFIDTMTAASTAGAPFSSATYIGRNSIA